MKYPISTGQAAALLGRTEPQLAELVRRGRIQPPPAIFAGRRLWLAGQVRRAAELLHVDLEEQLARREPASSAAVPLASGGEQ
ncbi:MAG: hypothetical protein EPO65_02685 [Dehalococcoidia bacterium]|nr:MAG: hypothetical protein EPO65_02685 [Dehalococcoidia bacterium]